MTRKGSRPTASNKLDEQILGNLTLAMVDLQGEIDALKDRLAAPGNTPPVDKSKEVAALVGLWIDRQKAEGALTVDLRRVDDIRTGIELALT